MICSAVRSSRTPIRSKFRWYRLCAKRAQGFRPTRLALQAIAKNRSRSIGVLRTIFNVTASWKSACRRLGSVRSRRSISSIVGRSGWRPEPGYRLWQGRPARAPAVPAVRADCFFSRALFTRRPFGVCRRCEGRCSRLSEPERAPTPQKMRVFDALEGKVADFSGFASPSLAPWPP